MVGAKNSNGARFRLLKALKKFALTSRNAPSPRKRGMPVRFAKLKSTAKYLGPRNELRPMPGGNTPPGLLGSKKANPPPGKFPPGLMNASLSVSSSAPPKYLVGREGQTKLFEFAERTHCPVCGVHGKPVCAVSMPSICQPPSTLPTKSWRLRNSGRSHKPETFRLCLTSKSDGPRSCRKSWGNVWFVSAPGPSLESVSMLLAQR